MKQGTSAWFEARKKRVTGSVAGAILGLSPFMSRDDVMRSMVRDALGAEREFKGNQATRHGNNTELEAKLMFMQETGLFACETGFHTFEDWLGASPDALVGDSSILEIKAPYGLRNKKEPAFKSIKEQPHYYAQLQIEMKSTCRMGAYFFQYVPALTIKDEGFYRPAMYKLERVDYDQAWHDQNIPILKEFYDEFLTELANPDKHLKPLRRDMTTDEAVMLIDDIDYIDMQMAQLKEARQQNMDKLIEMANDESVEIAGRKLTKFERRGSVDYKKIISEFMPDFKDEDKYRRASSTQWRLS